MVIRHFFPEDEIGDDIVQRHSDEIVVYLQCTIINFFSLEHFIQIFHHIILLLLLLLTHHSLLLQQFFQHTTYTI